MDAHLQTYMPYINCSMNGGLPGTARDLYEMGWDGIKQPYSLYLLLQCFHPSRRSAAQPIPFCQEIIYGTALSLALPTHQPE